MAEQDAEHEDAAEVPYEGVRMTVGQLVEQLQKLDPSATVRLSVGDPKDTAFTDEVTEVRFEDGVCTIDGWVSSENPEACAPWSYGE